MREIVYLYVEKVQCCLLSTCGLKTYCKLWESTMRDMTYFLNNPWILHFDLALLQYPALPAHLYQYSSSFQSIHQMSPYPNLSLQHSLQDCNIVSWPSHPPLLHCNTHRKPSYDSNNPPTQPLLLTKKKPNELPLLLPFRMRDSNSVAHDTVAIALFLIIIDLG